MEMDIHFYLMGSSDTHITSLYNISSNPFNLNDVVTLEVDNTMPVKECSEELIRENKELYDKFHFTNVKLIEESKSLTLKKGYKDKVVIEYYCLHLNEVIN